MRFEIDSSEIVVHDVNMRRIPWKRIEKAWAAAAKMLGAVVSQNVEGNNDDRTIRVKWAAQLPEDLADLAEDTMVFLDENFG